MRKCRGCDGTGFVRGKEPCQVCYGTGALHESEGKVELGQGDLAGEAREGAREVQADTVVTAWDDSGQDVSRGNARGACPQEVLCVPGGAVSDSVCSDGEDHGTLLSAQEDRAKRRNNPGWENDVELERSKILGSRKAFLGDILVVDAEIRVGDGVYKFVVPVEHALYFFNTVVDSADEFCSDNRDT